MIQDIAYETMRIPGFIAGIVLKMMSRQIESRVHFDILKLKPVEFARNCSVPCVFIIGKEDKLVYPKRVLETFDAYLGKQKVLIHSNGDHSSEREQHVLLQCHKFIEQHFKKNYGMKKKLGETQHPFLNDCKDSTLGILATIFEQKIESYGAHSKDKSIKNIAFQKNKYVFEAEINPFRKEQNSVNNEFYFGEFDFNESTKEDDERIRSKSDQTLSLYFEKWDQEIVHSSQDISDLSIADYNQHLNDISLFIKSKRF